MEHADDVPVTPEPTAGRGRFARLPDPIPLERTIASSESEPHPEEKDDYWREVEWMLRLSGGL